MNIEINIRSNTLALFDESAQRLRKYDVSTAFNGAGEKNGSLQTPRGLHVIRACIGKGQPANTVFIERRPSREIWTPQLASLYPGRDWILTRILWLGGCEPGKNRWKEVDTMRRYIYIHGSPDVVEMGKPGSRGCIRMRNMDIIELFDLVHSGTKVLLTE